MTQETQKPIPKVIESSRNFGFSSPELLKQFVDEARDCGFYATGDITRDGILLPVQGRDTRPRKVTFFDGLPDEEVFAGYLWSFSRDWEIGSQLSLQVYTVGGRMLSETDFGLDQNFEECLKKPEGHKVSSRLISLAKESGTFRGNRYLVSGSEDQQLLMDHMRGIGDWPRGIVQRYGKDPRTDLELSVLTIQPNKEDEVELELKALITAYQQLKDGQ